MIGLLEDGHLSQRRPHLGSSGLANTSGWEEIGRHGDAAGSVLIDGVRPLAPVLFPRHTLCTGLSPASVPPETETSGRAPSVRGRPVTAIPCPACGSPDTIPIVYGMPASDPAEDPAWAGLHSGGCVVGPEDRFCRPCGDAFIGAQAGATDPSPT